MTRMSLALWPKGRRDVAGRGLCSVNTLRCAPSLENTELFLIIENQGFLKPMKWRFIPCHAFPIYIFFSNSVVTKAEAACLGEVWEPSYVCQTQQTQDALMQPQCRMLPALLFSSSSYTLLDFLIWIACYWGQRVSLWACLDLTSAGNGHFHDSPSPRSLEERQGRSFLLPQLLLGIEDG